MAKTHYWTILDRDAHGYGAVFPDLPGCVGAGPTAEAAVRSAEEALSLHLEGLAEDGQPLPEPSAFDALETDPETVEAGRVLIGVEEPKAGERVNVFLQKVLLERIDRYVAALGAGGSRSGFLAQAAREKLEREVVQAATGQAMSTLLVRAALSGDQVGMEVEAILRALQGASPSGGGKTELTHPRPRTAGPASP